MQLIGYVVLKNGKVCKDLTKQSNGFYPNEGRAKAALSLAKNYNINDINSKSDSYEIKPVFVE